MYRLKSIKLYFFSILKLFFLSFRNYYFRSKFYNNKLVTYIPNRFSYYPSSYLAASLTSSGSDFYKIKKSSPELLWKINEKDLQNFNNLHSFFWLTKLDRKNDKKNVQSIIKSWINNFFNYVANTWQIEITSKRIISWASNFDITLEDSDKTYREKFFISIIKQSNFLLKNLNTLPYDSTKIICCSAIILSGIIFKENNLNFKFGLKELEKILKVYLDDNGFPKSRNPEELFISFKYLVLIREWFKEAHINIPNFLNDIIRKSGNSYSILNSSNKQIPLFNGATEANQKDYDTFLKTLKYKFNNKEHETGNIIKIKNKKIEFFMDCGNPPPENFVKNYQAGCLSFELISNKQKIICNSGYGKYFSSKLSSLSRSTAAHSTLHLNNTSSCIFQKNEIINKIFGNSLLEKHKIMEKNYTESKDFYSISASHNGYEKKFGYIHKRSVKIFKNEDKILGIDELKKTKKNFNSVMYSIRFHIYPNIKAVKTKGGNSVLISLPNGEGWLLRSYESVFNIEKNIFFGNKKKILNNESESISGNTSETNMSINWSIERVD